MDKRPMTNGEKMMLRSRAWEGKRRQADLVSSAILKLKMMGLTPANGMVECPPPDGIHPFRWNAMVASAFNNQDSSEG